MFFGLSVAIGWHRNKVEFGTRIAIIHSEASEALEGHRKDLMDDHLPHRKMAEVELADCVIRIFDLELCHCATGELSFYATEENVFCLHDEEAECSVCKREYVLKKVKRPHWLTEEPVDNLIIKYLK